jgi:hypothetical protein
MDWPKEVAIDAIRSRERVSFVKRGIGKVLVVKR